MKLNPINNVITAPACRSHLKHGRHRLWQLRHNTAILQRLTGDDFLRAAPDFAAADAKLNTVYRKIQDTRGSLDQGTVTKDGIRKAQRAWLHYRDAWGDFAKIKFPSLALRSLKAALTDDRIKSLEGFAN